MSSCNKILKIKIDPLIYHKIKIYSLDHIIFQKICLFENIEIQLQLIQSTVKQNVSKKIDDPHLLFNPSSLQNLLVFTSLLFDIGNSCKRSPIHLPQQGLRRLEPTSQAEVVVEAQAREHMASG